MPSRPPHSTKTWAPNSAPSSVASQAFFTAKRRIWGSLAVNAPSLKMGRQNRFVVTIGTCIPVASSARRNRLTMSWRSATGDAGRHEIVVVEAHAVGAQVGQSVHGVDGIEGRPDRLPEGVPPGVPDGPEAEGELVLGPGSEVIGHGSSYAQRARAVPPLHPRLIGRYPRLPE